MSNCCNAPPLGEIVDGICSACREHAEFNFNEGDKMDEIERNIIRAYQDAIKNIRTGKRTNGGKKEPREPRVRTLKRYYRIIV